MSRRHTHTAPADDDAPSWRVVAALAVSELCLLLFMTLQRCGLSKIIQAATDAGNPTGGGADVDRLTKTITTLEKDLKILALPIGTLMLLAAGIALQTSGRQAGIRLLGGVFWGLVLVFSSDILIK